MAKVVVAGVGMTPFVKPGTSDTYDIMGAKALQMALKDAGLAYDQVQQAYAGYVYGDSCCGQRVLYSLGMTGVPVVNVNNNCSSGATALYLARQAVESGAVDCALAVGFEQMNPGSLQTAFSDRPSPMDIFQEKTDKIVGHPDTPFTLRLFGGAGRAYMDQYGITMEPFAKIRAKASVHGANNPRAIFRKVIDVDAVMNDIVVFPGVMTRLMACPPTCGAAAAIVCTEAFARKNGLQSNVYIAAQTMVSDLSSTFDTDDMRQVIGYDVSAAAASQVYEAAGVGPEEIDVVELHDCFAQHELLLYEALGFCPEGGAPQFIDDGDNTYGGKIVSNPSGGLLSRGHPLGATGVAQCVELVEQLRGQAGRCQVEGARIGLQHNFGQGGACVVTMYRND